MRGVVLFCLLSGFASVLSAGDPITTSEFHARRKALRESLKDGLTILVGATESERGNLRTPFFQESNFYYLTGWKEPGAILVLSTENDILFIPRRNPEREKWTGRKIAPDDKDARSLSGFDTVEESESFEARLPSLAKAASKIYTLKDQPSAEKLRAQLPLREFADAANAIAKLRMTKSSAELALIKKSTDVTMEAHRAAWKRIAAGLYEYQVAAAMSNLYFESGCERHAYPPIVGSGPNSTILHYGRNSRRLDSGEVLLMDVAAECSYYASDVTRTVPVNGKFTARQRELYEIVLGAQMAAIAAVKPGATLAKTGPNSLYQVALEYLNAHGKDLKGNPLGPYFTHGIGHHVGLDVHDPNDPSLPLGEGMVVTIEPGLYIPDEGIGVRIEDVVLVTATGAEVLSSSLPKTVEEIEQAFKR